MNENGELSLVGGSEDKAYKQLVTDSNGRVKWEDRLVYVNVTTSDGETYTADKTLDEINELIKQEFNVKALLTLPNGGYYYFTIQASSPESCLFSLITPKFGDIGKALLLSITINASEVKVNTIEF